MAIEISEIEVRNFKNLKNVRIKPGKFNVVVGPNGSGKTNLLEFFKLLRKIYVERNPYPFLEWDGYENVVWNHQRSLPIEFRLETVERASLNEIIKDQTFLKDAIKLEKIIPLTIYRSIYASFWADKSENLKMLLEGMEFKIPELDFKLVVEKSGDVWTVDINGKLYKQDAEKVGLESLYSFIISSLEDSLRFSDFGWAEEPIKDLFVDQIIPSVCIQRMEISKSLDEFDEMYEKLLKEPLAKGLKKLGVQKLEATAILDLGKEEKMKIDLSSGLISYLFSKAYAPFLIIFKTALLLPLNLTEIKYKRILPTDEPLKERGENALDILALTQLRENKLPDRIEYALETYFNGRGYFKERNFYFYDLNTRTEFSKEHLPEGMLKLIVILTALERNPAILMIDEVENSLHPEILEFLVEVLKESEGSVFLTTHSPVVLNLVEPEEVFIFKPTTEGIEIRNLTEFKSKEDLLKELEELGINLGDKVFFGLT
ncbi:MAG: hypothetical protein XD40_1314 [Archaeoglobus fulgidus]|uniref:DUF2813 domain-containing protein n=1 Tax=Archaeoglobus fulgidus TaxID=2234 RepID=A0A101DYS2_ARCFL|nr:AAA family ATPase [Archaeoglobus fulgidus]KUJ93464.1 MAG: hypothetical protein XD40_1314 [Archaeoglobus fulgidus]KUK05758.1 MAG: hypothetical protein XD48_2003 [Archaeoglobus fulgidus]